MNQGRRISRRQFVSASAAMAAMSIVPVRVLAKAGRVPPSETIQIAAVGIGGVGHGQIRGISEQPNTQIVALCDVDDAYAKKTYDLFPKAGTYRDFRQMLEAEGDKIDAVYCGTPDHTHAVVTMPALKRGKHVCCVKPLTRTIHENRALAEAARQAGVATQVTAAPNTSDGACRLCEMIWDGAIGDVREVHCWSNRPLWPQGMVRPTGEDPVPKTLDWDLWIGPAAMRPFKNEWPAGHLALDQLWFKDAPHAVYHPWNFRGWWEFGTGALGDMGCHHFNTVYRAMKLRYPTRIEASSTKVMAETAPLASMVTYEFPSREGMPPLRLFWYDGGLKPPRPAELEPGQELPTEGDMYVGDKGKILEDKIIPESKMKAYTQPPKTLQRRSGTWGEWVEAIRGGEPAGCNFDQATLITEAVLLGNIAIRTSKTLDYDGQTVRFTNNDAANEYIKQPYRSGWTL
jgi:predicted dehydrogenase